MADQVLYSGVACITDLMVKEGLINLDFADVRAVMREMGKAMMGTGEASGENRARHAAEAAIANPLLDDVSMHGARGLLISITGGPDLTLYEVDEAATRIREEVDPDANIILGATFDEALMGTVRVSVVATGTEATMVQAVEPMKPHPARAPLDATQVRRPIHEPQPVAEPELGALETQVQRAVANAITSEPVFAPYEDDGVTVEPHYPAAFAPTALEDVPRIIDAPMPNAYVPPSAARPDGQRRMPRTEELPLVARRAVEPEKAEEPRNARGLFRKLASNVGLGLRPAAAAPSSEDHAAQSAIEAGAARPQARREPEAEEQIEIPAFLRKHG